MTDCELLELAENASGMSAAWHADDDGDIQALGEGMWLKGKRSPDNSKYWNPLRDDGDALRLAVELGIDVQHFVESRRVEAWAHLHDICSEDYGSDPCAATRRAIVRAAAQIGKALR